MTQQLVSILWTLVNFCVPVVLPLSLASHWKPLSHPDEEPQSTLRHTSRSTHSLHSILNAHLTPSTDGKSGLKGGPFKNKVKSYWLLHRLPHWTGSSWRDKTEFCSSMYPQSFSSLLSSIGKLCNRIHFKWPSLLYGLVLPRESQEQRSENLEHLHAPLSHSSGSWSFKGMHQIWVTYCSIKCASPSACYWERRKNARN